MFVGMSFPFFGGLLGFIGGFAFAPTTYFVSIKSLKKKKKKFSINIYLFSSKLINKSINYLILYFLLCFQLPCVIWLKIYKPRRWSASWITNWFCIFFGVLLMILSPIGGLKQIISQAKTYRFYS